jgi:phage-related protein
MVADLFTHLDPDSNPYTKKFIDGLNNLLVACQNFALSAGGWFKTFVDNGGQAFLNVMGDIIMIIGTTLANTLANVINWITLFMNSWAGQLLIEGVAIALDLLAGAIKAVMIVIEELTPVWSALITAMVVKAGIDGVIGLFGKLTNKLVDFGLKIASNIEDVVVWGKDIAIIVKDTIKNFGAKLKDGYQHLKDFASKLKDNVKAVLDWNKSHIKNLDDVKGGWKKFKDDLKQRISDIGTHLKDGINKVKDWCKDWKTHLNTLKTTITTKLNGIKTAFTNNWSAIKTWGANTVKMVKDTIAKAISSFTTWISTLTLADVWTGICTATTWLLNAALAVLTSPITLIILAITALIVIIKEVGDHFDWWTKIMDWLKEKCGWLYDGIMKLIDGVKGFFGWDGENKIEPEVDKTKDDLGSLGDTIEETSDRFGTACSAMNEALNSVGIDSNKLGLQLDAYEERFNEAFSRMSENAQTYIQAVRDGNKETLEEMSGNADEYLGELQYSWSRWSQEERALFVETHGYFEGVTDDWLDYSKLSYNDAAIAFQASLKEMENRQGLSVQELDRMQAEGTENFRAYRDEYLKIVEQNIADIENAEGISEEQRYNDLRYWLDEKAAIEGKTTDQLIQNLNTYEDAVKTSADVQKEAYDGVADEQTKALEGVSTTLEDTKADLASFKEESDKVANEIPKEWEGIGETITQEFSNALIGIATNMQTILTNTQIQCQTLKTGLQLTFQEITNGVELSMQTLNTTMTTSFSKTVQSIATLGEQLKENLRSTLMSISEGVTLSFTTIKTTITDTMVEIVETVNSKLVEMNSKVRELLQQLQNGIKTTNTAIKTEFKNVMNDIETNIKNKMTSINNAIDTNMTKMTEKIDAKMQEMVESVKEAIEEMKKVLSTELPTPKLKLPHIKQNGTWNAETGQAPSWSVSWHAKGGIFDSPTIFNTNKGLQGVGEAGAEAILPLDKLWQELGNQFSRQTSQLANMNKDNRPINLVLQVDGKELAKTTVNGMDELARVGQLNLSFL